MLEGLIQARNYLTAKGMPWEPVDVQVQDQTVTSYAGCPNSLRELIPQLAAHGDKEAILFMDDRITFNRLVSEVYALSHALVEEFQIKPGQRVAIAMRNYPEWISTFLAVTAIGAVAVPLNSWGKSEELVYGLEDSGSHLVFVDAQRRELLTPYLPTLGIRAISCRDEQVAPGGATYTALIERFAATELHPQAPKGPEDLALIMYTSGTTGHPKGVMSSHRAVLLGVMNVEFSGAIVGMQYPEFAQKMQQMMASGIQPAGMLTVPLFHVSGLHANALSSLRGGRKLVMLFKWDPQVAADLVRDEGVSTLSGAPKMIEDFLTVIEQRGQDISHMGNVATGGSAQSPALTERIRRLVPNALQGGGYGMTEANSTITVIAGKYCNLFPKSVGLPLPIVGIEIRNDAGQVMPVGERGEIWVRGGMLMQGYWNKQQATEESLVDGWYASGDIGVIDEHGLIYIVDRKKDIVIRGGENIACAEVELVIDALDGVAECAAFGKPDEEWGEQLLVVVVPREGVTLTAEQVREHVKAHLATFKVPSEVHFQNEALPRNALNKVVKPELKARYLAG